MPDTTFIFLMYLISIASFGLVVVGSRDKQDERTKELFYGFIFVIILFFVVLYLLDKKSKNMESNKSMENAISIEQQLI